MENTFNYKSFPITAESKQDIPGGCLLKGTRVGVKLSIIPTKYLYSGWQSWSFTSWVEINRKINPLRPRIMQPRESDPVYSTDTRPNGSWYGAVKFSDNRILFLGAVDLNAHVFLGNNDLHGIFETGNGMWFLAEGTETEVLKKYSELLMKKFGKMQELITQRVWCSWYSLYTEIDENRLLKILHDFGKMGSKGHIPFDVFQVDDGWQKKVGDWEPNGKFHSGMKSLTGIIKESGREAGLWLAPLIVVSSSKLFNSHPDWILKNEKGKPVSAGFNWGEWNYALDTTHPEVLGWLSELMKKVRDWGFDYLKLDFLYAGALPGKRYRSIPREDAYRLALDTIREAMGDAYFLACGAPIIPSLGLCDGLRIGQDVAEYWSSPLFDQFLENFGAPGVRNALCNVVHRLWLKDLVQMDPDVVYFSSKHNTLLPKQKELLKSISEICRFKATSDLPNSLSQSEKKELFEFLHTEREIRHLDNYRYQIGEKEIDFEPYIKLPQPPGLFTRILGIILGGIANSPLIINSMDKLNQYAIRRRLRESN